jgi:hypothetical protein
MLAIGTSLMWGNGLTPQNTFRHMVADWTYAQTGRPVELTTYAHSSAVVATANGSSHAENSAPWIGDLNNPVPSVDDQIECSAHTGNLSQADFILVEGCINDIGAESIVYPWTTPKEIDDGATTYCEHEMSKELQKIDRYFPKAIVVVVGYYPLVTLQTPLLGFFGVHSTRRAADYATKVRTQKQPNAAPPPPKHKGRREEGNTITENSEEFYQRSKESLKKAVAAVAGTSPRFFFAQMPEGNFGGNQPTMDPRFAYGAPDTHLWPISIRFLWWGFFKDDKYWFRQPLCDVYDPLPELAHFVCQTNPAFHPNVPGSAVYATSIQAVVPSSVIDGWKTH